MPVQSCPKCGAMIVPQLSRCRQCKAYLHGTRVEGFVLEQLLPAQLTRAPATATLCLAICLYYALMIAAGGDDAILGFSGYTLQALGATHGPSILLGQYWRFVTSIFAHHDLVHLAFNLSSLVVAGEIVERIFDRKKMLLIYLGAGIASMMISHLWYVYVLGHVTIVSAGASGAVCGLIGAALFGARKLGPQGTEMVARMKRWALLMVIWGFAMPGINNAAHLGGFAVGALLAHLTPAGITQTVRAQRILSVIATALIGVVLGCTVLMIDNMRAARTSLEDDQDSRYILGYLYYHGRDWRHSDQRRIFDQCASFADLKQSGPDAIEACELNRRANDDRPDSYTMLASILDQRGDTARAAALRDVAARIAGVN